MRTGAFVGLMVAALASLWLMQITAAPAPPLLLGALPGARLYSLTAIDDHTAWAAGENSVWRTVDSGRRWSSVRLPIAMAHLGSEGLARVQAALFEGVQSATVALGDALFQTEDAGAAWIRLPRLPVPGSYRIIGEIVRVPHTNEIVVAGNSLVVDAAAYASAEPRNRGHEEDTVWRSYILRSAQEGKNWRRLQTPGTPAGLRQVMFSSESSGFALVRNSESVWITSDGGANWRTSRFNRSCVDGSFLDHGLEDDELSRIFSLTPSLAWLSGDDGYLFRTTNGGATWCQLQRAGQTWPASRGAGAARELPIVFRNSSQGWMIGGNFGLYQTDDGGSSWRSVHPGPIDLISLSSHRLWIASHGKLLGLPI